MRSARRVAHGVLLGALLVTMARPAVAGDFVVNDPAGDATPDACGAHALSCQWTGGESQPAADILSVRASATGGVFALDVTYVDIDRPIPRVGNGDRIRDEVSFRLGDRLAAYWPWVAVSTYRDFDGAPLSTATPFRVTGKDGMSQTVPGSVSIDRTANRLRFSASVAELARAVQSTCPGCASLSRGAVLWSFFAYSQATATVTAAGTGVGVHMVASDTGWPGDGSYVMP